MARKKRCRARESLLRPRRPERHLREASPRGERARRQLVEGERREVVEQKPKVRHERSRRLEQLRIRIEHLALEHDARAELEGSRGETLGSPTGQAFVAVPSDIT